MNTIRLCIDKQSNSTKPEKYGRSGIIAIKNRLHEYPRELELPILADMVGNKGHAFYCGILSGGSSGEHWQHQQLVVLDYDDEGINYNDVYSMFEGLELTPTFSYKTLRYKEEYHKFRLVWALNEPIYNDKVARAITYALITISENRGYKVDPASRKIAQMWLGGKGLLHTNFNKTLTLELLFNECISECLTDTKNATRKLTSLCRELGVNQLNNKPSITPIDCFSGDLESMVVSNGLVFDFGTFIKKKDNTYKANVNKRKQRLNRPIRIDLKGNIENCQLLHEMTTGEHIKKYPHSTHEQFFGLATNLHGIEGGAALLENVILNHDYSNKRNKLTTLDVARDMNYLPMTCNKFCPYHSQCGAYNVTSAIQGTKRLGVDKVADIPTVTLEHAREQLHEIMDYIYSPYKEVAPSEDMSKLAKMSLLAKNMIEGEHWKQSLHTVVIGTGVGKTHALKNRDLKGTVNCFKTHDLCKEFIKDNPNDNILYVKALNTDNMPQDMQDELQLRYMCKADVKGFLQRQIEPYGADTNNPLWYYDIKEYLECIEQIKEADSVVMTHKRMSYMYSLGNQSLTTITFDEDALTELLQLSSIDYYRAYELLRCAYDVALNNPKYQDIIEPLKKSIDFLNQVKEGTYIDTSSNVLDYKTVTKIRKCITNELGHDVKQVYAILPFFSYIAITRTQDTIQGITERVTSLPKIKTVILSATVNEQLMRMLFNRFAPNRAYYHHEVAEVKHKGQLILHSGKTYSRTSVADDSQYIIELANKHNVKSVITYKANITQFKNREKNTDIKFMNYGDCLGYNAMSGDDIVIIGTPNIPSWVYELYGFTLTGQIPQSKDWSIKKIIRNGFEFPLNTYTNDCDKVFTNIQLYFVISEIQQAVGRARLVNQECTVHLYSNIPLPQCIIDNTL